MALVIPRWVCGQKCLGYRQHWIVVVVAVVITCITATTTTAFTTTTTKNNNLPFCLIEWYYTNVRGDVNQLCWCYLKAQRRQSLPPPPPQCPAPVTWELYSSTQVGKPLPIGRPVVSKQSSKSFRASVAMVCYRWQLSSNHCRNYYY